MVGTVMANQAAHRAHNGEQASDAAFKITDDMLVQAAKIDDIDQAVASVMDQVGITDGGVAGLVLDYAENWWAGADQAWRLTKLRQWQDAEQVYAQDALDEQD